MLCFVRQYHSDFRRDGSNPILSDAAFSASVICVWQLMCILWCVMHFKCSDSNKVVLLCMLELYEFTIHYFFWFTTYSFVIFMDFKPFSSIIHNYPPQSVSTAGWIFWFQTWPSIHLVLILSFILNSYSLIPPFYYASSTCLSMKVSHMPLSSSLHHLIYRIFSFITSLCLKMNWSVCQSINLPKRQPAYDYVILRYLHFSN